MRRQQRTSAAALVLSGEAHSGGCTGSASKVPSQGSRRGSAAEGGQLAGQRYQRIHTMTGARHNAGDFEWHPEHVHYHHEGVVVEEDNRRLIRWQE